MGRMERPCGMEKPRRNLPRRMCTVLWQKRRTFYKSVMLHPDARPNPGHYALARLEKQGRLKAIVTQNIDGLHQQAGSRVVFELHGSLNRFYCTRCRAAFPAEQVYHQKTTPRCDACGGLVRPDVILYGEQLDPQVLNASAAAVRQVVVVPHLAVIGVRQLGNDRVAQNAMSVASQSRLVHGGDPRPRA